MVGDARDAFLTREISEWFAHNARALPWRTTPRDPYRSLVSEIMLQQTQVSRVVDKFEAFVRKYPTPGALAGARETAVLAAWSGLGYYRRARMLQAAARSITRDFAGEIPREVERLLELPGVGRYTAGAIASIVHGLHEPIVDGNVARVLLRVDGKRLDHGRGMAWSWRRAAELVAASNEPASFNEGLMELGATICTPRAPDCGRCPLASQCRARRAGTVGVIPRAKPASTRRTFHASVAIVRDSGGRVLIERRARTGLWAGMWQAPTVESSAPIRSAKALADRLGLGAVTGWRAGDRFEHVTTHRRVIFRAWVGRLDSPAMCRTWTSLARLERLAISSPQRRLLLGEGRVVTTPRRP